MILQLAFLLRALKSAWGGKKQHREAKGALLTSP